MRSRDYQQEAEDACFEKWGNGTKSVLVVLPTGTGKTVLMAKIIKRLLPKRSLLLAHREELIFQARDKLMFAAGIECEIEKAELVASTSLWNRSPCVVGSIQSLISGKKEKRRYSRFDPKEFDCLLFDEAHHCPSASYKEIQAYFQNGNPDIKVFGCTATPDRSDEEALGQCFQEVAYDYELLDAINDGWLVPVEQHIVRTTLDWSHIKTTAGDLNGADLATVMESEDAIQGVAGATLKIVGNRRTLIFVASVKQAEMLCDVLNRPDNKPGCAEWVCGDTPRDARREMLKRFQNGDTQIVVNCAVLTEGFDNPYVEVVVMARPTKSRSLYSQMVGRGTRPLPGVVDAPEGVNGRRMAIALSRKRALLVIDFVGNSGRHKLMTAADILGGRVSEQAVENTKEKAAKSGKTVNIKQLLEEEEKKLREAAEKKRLAEAARKANVVAKVSFTTSIVDPFDMMDISPATERGWDNGRTLSPAQLGMLRKFGIDASDLPFSHGKQLLNELFRRLRGGLALPGQLKILKRTNPDLNTRTLGRQEAAKIISSLGNRNKNTRADDYVPFEQCERI